ncbi:MAG: hypothetical protein KKA75_05455 [Proteobacteria bacterium]|nr:hypothetical protein [Pseudomonadota bacterium]
MNTIINFYYQKSIPLIFFYEGIGLSGFEEYHVTWSEDYDEYVGLCAEFPGLSWLALTLEAALKGIRKLVAGVVRDMDKTGGDSLWVCIFWALPKNT